MALFPDFWGFGLLHLGIWLGLPPGLASLVNQSQAVFVGFFAVFVLRDPPNGMQKLGLLLAAAEVAPVSCTFHDRAGIWGLCSIIGAALPFAWSHIEPKLSGVADILRLSAWIFTVSAPVSVALSFALDARPWESLTHIFLFGLDSVLYTGFIATLLGQYLWGYVIERNPPTVVVPFVLLVPVFGFVWSALLFGEAFTLAKAVAPALMFLGLRLSVFGRKHRFRSGVGQRH